ncbi:unnamed protein product [Paramecium sonneborni]|uniref:Tetratricopeptide repeat protein n=1 Tax=Paramecium sonneborni TaxID=65129 RepID=A0A8S1N4C2_9CILI|nr:unnamed protein product [Paramecium sonneborni]
MLKNFCGFSNKLVKITINNKIYFNFNILGSKDVSQLIRDYKENSKSKSNDWINDLLKEIQYQIENSHNQAVNYSKNGNFKDAELVLQKNCNALQDLLSDINIEIQPNFENIYLANAKSSLLLGDCYLRQSNFDQADSSLLYSLNILNQMNPKIDKVQINLLDTLILQYQQNLYSIFDDKQLKEIEDKINDLIKNSQNEELQMKYQIFKIKYLEEDKAQIDKLFNLLKTSEQSSTDLTNFLMKQAMNKGNSKSALFYCNKLLNSLITNYDPNHYLFESSITNFFALSRENQEQNQYEELIQKIKLKFFNQGFEALEKIILFEQILNQGLQLINKQSNIDQIQNLINKLEVIKFTSGSKYQRYAIFMLLGLKRELKEIQSSII